MDRRLAELRQRLWKKKAALQQKENLPVSLLNQIQLVTKTFLTFFDANTKAQLHRVFFSDENKFLPVAIIC